MSNKKNTVQIPKDGWAGLKENFTGDLASGFVVFLLALPLSLGIAKASEFPPIMGLVSAIIGGLLATFFTGSKLAIKGPAAGLIVILAGAVGEFGGGVEGWRLALSVLVVAGLVQVMFGVFKLGRLVDFFPLSAVHGMLAAIGLIIIGKQIPVLLNVDPALTKGKEPLELFAEIPHFIAHLDPKVSIIGIVSLVILLGWGFVKHKILKQIPAPLLVLLFAIPAGIYMNLGTDAPSYTLVKVGNLIEQIGYNVDFSGFSQTGIFIKYVIMVALVGSLESLLTVKAIDLLDPYKRKSDPNKDIIAVGIANTIAGFLGGVPMISEVARSSANVAQGGKTRWANFFHGAFLLIFALAAYPLLEKIPNAALAAMLIVVGINLAHPKEFLHTYKIGSEQLAIFITTIFFTLFEDLLVGIAAGIVLKMLIHVFRGANFRTLFKKSAKLIIEDEDNVTLKIGEMALFTNYLSLKKELDAIPAGKNVTIEITDTKIIDHSVMENLHHFEEDYEAAGGSVRVVDLLDNLIPVSDHPYAARIADKKQQTPAPKLPPKPFDEAHVLHELDHYLPSQLALKDFVHHNSLHSFQDKEFFDGVFSAAKIFGIQPTLNLNEYRKLHAQGRIKPSILDRVIVEHKGARELNAFRKKMLEGQFDHDAHYRVGSLRAYWKKQYQLDLDNLVQPLLFRIIASFLDQGISIWHFPFDEKGLINAIKTMEDNSFASFFKTKKARKLLFSEDLSIEKLLQIVVGDSNYYENYLFDQQFAHKGWSGLITAIESTPDTLLYEKNITLKDFIILELLLEIDALEKALDHNWKPLAINIDLPPQDYFAQVEKTELNEVLQLWHEAFEWDYYDEVLSGVGHLVGQPRQDAPIEKTFQALFCIDDREDALRRYIEQCDPNAQTVGAPGFYGAAIYYQAYGANFYEKYCPPTLTPKHLIKEIKVTKAIGKELLHDKYTHTLFRGFLYSLSLGLVASGRMLWDLFRPKTRHDMADAFSYMDPKGELLIETEDPSHRENGLQVGYTVEEMADIVQSLLTNVGMVKHFAPIVYVVGHGGSSANNPHLHAYDCGACSGSPGATNARVFAFMANHPKVRLILEDRGFNIPRETQFLGAMHDTTSDEIGYYDEEILSPKNAAKHKIYIETIENALDLDAKERARRFASIDLNQDIKKIRKDIKDRSVSYFEARPELGHGSNALCYVGVREQVKGLFLDRRAFHQSYDYRLDPDGKALAQVMAPLPPVCGGINLEYYFSRVDIEKMGAGTKLPYNVVGLYGVTNSSDGDLRSGLPIQTVENHDPVRLLLMVEHYPDVLLKVISESQEMYDWFAKGWVHLVAVSPESGELYYFRNGQFEKYQPLTNVRKTSDMMKVIERTDRMVTNHIVDATKENIPVHIIE